MAISRLNLGTTNQVLVKAAAGQTSNLLELQNSSGTVVAGLNQDGVWSGTAEPGLVLLNTTSFSGVASQAITQFSATYENYRMLIRITAQGTANGDHSLRMRSGSTDDSGSNYFTGGTFNRANSTTVSALNQNAASSYFIGNGVTTATGIYYVVDILSPFLTQKTCISTKSFSEDATYSYASQKDGVHNLTTSYDGINIITSAGTITGKVAIYGYNF
jgi:hypothetical protein